MESLKDQSEIFVAKTHVHAGRGESRTQQPFCTAGALASPLRIERTKRASFAKARTFRDRTFRAAESELASGGGAVIVGLHPAIIPMRTRHLNLAALAIAALVAPVSIPAVDAPPADIKAVVAAEIVQPDTPETILIARTGDNALRWLGARMVYEIRAALAKGSPEAAIEICHLKTISKGDQVLPGMPSVTAFKCTSLRPLRAANAPDAAERAVLEEMRQDIAAGTPPGESILQRVTLADGTVNFRVYRPLAAMPGCLTCHGDPTTQSPELRARLLEQQTGSGGNGFTEGELRGVLRVTIATPAPP